MAVPTIYSRLIAAWQAAPMERQAALSAGCRKLRLMVSGSAALPVRVLEQWQEISGHVLLERYGMTEIGMALSNPLRGRRRPGFVGVPLPGVAVRLVDEQGREVPLGTPGEIEVRGPSVFREYRRRPEATEAAFRDGWFRTGDIAVVEQGFYRILGRSSVDILKTGGYKVSALEIEEALREHPAIRELAVVGLPDPEWGERIGAALVLAPGSARRWRAAPLGRDRLAPYKLPTRLLALEKLPRNAMGKVIKPDVVRLFTGLPVRRPRETTRFANRATSPPRLPSPDRGGSGGARPSAAIPGAEGSCCQAPHAADPRVAARLRASRPGRCLRACPRQPEVVGVNRDLLGGGTPVLSPLAEGRRDAGSRPSAARIRGAAGAGGVSVLLVEEDAWVACFLPDWLLGSTLCGSVTRAAGAGGVSVLLVGEGAWVARFPPDWLLSPRPSAARIRARRGRWCFGLAGRGRCLGGPLLAGLVLGHARSLDRWAPRAGQRLRE